MVSDSSAYRLQLCANFRCCVTEPVPGVTERYTVSYTFEGTPVPQFDDQFTFAVGPDLAGDWTATVRF